MINDDSSLNLTGPLAWLYFTLFLWARQTEAKLQTTSWCKVETKSTDRLLRSRKQQTWRSFNCVYSVKSTLFKKLAGQT